MMLVFSFKNSILRMSGTIMNRLHIINIEVFLVKCRCITVFTFTCIEEDELIEVRTTPDDQLAEIFLSDGSNQIISSVCSTELFFSFVNSN